MTPAESDRLQRAIAGCLLNPFIDDILDFNWEAIWHYCKGLPIPDPLSATRKKYLHDAIDPKAGVGWSLKTQQITSAITECKAYAVVIARADIFGKNRGLHRDSKPADIGQAILKLWASKVEADRAIQKVRTTRVATLLKSPKRTEFGVHETALKIYKPGQLKWLWAEKSGKGLWGLSRETGKQVYRWYPSGGQLFEIFQVPRNVVILKLQWNRLPAGPVLSKLEELTKVPLEKLVDERPKSAG